jgi:hypothetical protein
LSQNQKEWKTSSHHQKAPICFRKKPDKSSRGLMDAVWSLFALRFLLVESQKYYIAVNRTRILWEQDERQRLA